MNDRAAHLISTLGLQPHPEGGHFREIFRSTANVHSQDGRGERSALTTIYFLLRAGEQSRLHRVSSDEVWHFYEGDPLELLWTGSGYKQVQQVRLGLVSSDTAPVAVVPAGCWQAARSTGAYTLVGCSVGPGFDFADFQMLSDSLVADQQLCEQYPELHPFF
ncbi:cupin domain-containing protein [Phormidium tenue FACHB-886]|nr:cupin domain-containing protein [Phormidium tenue FACHB-886]